MIRAVWYNPKNKYDDKWERFTPKEFIQRFNIKKQKYDFVTDTYLPNDEFTITDFKDRIMKMSKTPEKGEETFQAYLKAYLKDRYAHRFELRQMGFFPKQIEEILRLRNEGEFQKWIK